MMICRGGCGSVLGGNISNIREERMVKMKF